LCEEKLPTFYIDSPDKILSQNEILHYNFHSKQELHTVDYLPSDEPVRILITSGASCPDAVVEAVIRKFVSFYEVDRTVEDILSFFD
jgi:4-hydroxy-3-methylbut-2-enyl diphosphate reductase